MAISKDLLREWHDRVGRAKPFLRWAGGKQLFTMRYSGLLPAFPGKYLEPFLGSGAVFFHIMRTQLRPPMARLGDTNRQLISSFQAVRDEPEAVYERLEILQAGYSAARDKAQFYYDVRDRHNAIFPKADPAAFILLNRTCWNGLYRVNREGRFNVPYGAPKSDTVIPTRAELLSASAALAQAHLRVTSWENTLAFAEGGDFVFLDPPYYSDVLREDAKYSRQQFTLRKHEQLAKACIDLAARGIDFILTNSGEPEMIELYRSHGLQLESIEMPRPINSKTDKRSAVPEILVRPLGSKPLPPPTDPLWTED